MNSIKHVLFLSVFSLSAVVYAGPTSDNIKRCNQIWQDVETNFSNKNLHEALFAVGMFADNECLDENDAAKKRQIAQVRAENSVSTLEKIVAIDKSFAPSEGQHAHTTSECLLRDYKRDASEVDAYFDSYATIALFQGLQQDDVNAYKMRINAVKMHIDNVLLQIKQDQSGQCMQNLDGRIEKAVTENTSRLSVADQLRIDNKIAEIEATLSNSKLVISKATKRCQDIGSTLSIDPSSPTKKCFENMLEFVKQDYKEQIEILRAEKAKSGNLK